MTVRLNVLAFALLLTLRLTSCYNVLFLLPACTKSHYYAAKPIAEELTKRGHKVTFVVPFQIFENNNKSDIINIYFEEGDILSQNPNLNFFKSTSQNISHLNERFETFEKIAASFYQMPFIIDLIKEPKNHGSNKPKYDIVVVNMIFNEFGLPIAHHLNVPNVVFSPSLLLPNYAWMLDIPYPLSYRPLGIIDFSQPMTFIQRFSNVFFSTTFYFMNKFKSFKMYDRVVEKHLPNTPSIEDLIRNVSFVITNSHFSMSGTSPSMPYYVETGGLHCMPAKPLPKELEDWMKHSDGVIYFSLGSFTQGNSMPEVMKSIIISVFSKLKQRIIWKYEEDIPDLPKHIKLVKWAPQQDILAHSNIRLFISHGGGLSTAEAVYHGCPILGFPLSAEQIGNMAQAKIHGFGEHLEWRTLTEEQLLNLIVKMLNNNSYKENAMHASVLLKDRPQPPAETAAYWIEYVVRHDGATFLKTSARHLNFFQYFLLDVLTVVIGGLIMAGYCCLLIGCFLYKTLCNFQKHPVKTTSTRSRRKYINIKKNKN